MWMSCMKPLTAQWMINLHGHLASHPNIIINGFRAARILKRKWLVAITHVFSEL